MSTYLSQILSKERARQDSADRKKRQLKELKDMKTTMRELRRDADQQLKLELESQQTFEFLAAQIRTLRNALISVADVVVEEIDVAKAELAHKNLELEEQISGMSNSVRVLQTENTLLKSEFDTYRQNVKLQMEEMQAEVERTTEPLQQQVEQAVEAVKDTKKENRNLSYAVVELEKKNERYQKSLAEKINSVDKEITSTIEDHGDRFASLKKELSRACTALAMDISVISQQTTKCLDQQQKMTSSLNTLEHESESQRQEMESQALDSGAVNKRIDKFKESVLGHLHNLNDRINKQGHAVEGQFKIVDKSMGHHREKWEELAREFDKKHKAICGTMNSMIDMFTKA